VSLQAGFAPVFGRSQVIDTLHRLLGGSASALSFRCEDVVQVGMSNSKSNAGGKRSPLSGPEGEQARYLDVLHSRKATLTSFRDCIQKL
jgi:hypothetical protein